MEPDRPSPCIVVGYDGSPPARAAMRLALDRVGSGKIFLVYGYDAPADYWGGAHYDQLLNLALTRGENVLEQAHELDPRLAEADHELELIAGRPGDVIADVAATRDADEIIMGTRGYGPLRGMLGSVAHTVLHQATCPVTVIPQAALPRIDAEADASQRERVGG